MPLLNTFYSDIVHHLNYLYPRSITCALAFFVCMTCATLAVEHEASDETPELFKPVMPTIPESISRPSDWPTSIPSNLSKNVLSSILEKPGAPLEPVDEDKLVLADLLAKLFDSNVLLQYRVIQTCLKHSYRFQR